MIIYRTKTRIVFPYVQCIASELHSKHIPGIDVKYITSPGLRILHTYKNNRSVYYNISCGEGKRIRLHITMMDLQGKIQQIQGNLEEWLCVDYINISAPAIPNIILCGVSIDQPWVNIPGSEVLITFRTSMKTARRGFSMTAVCYRLNDNNGSAAGCAENKVRDRVNTVLNPELCCLLVNVKDWPINDQPSATTTRLIRLYQVYSTAAHILSGNGLCQ